MSTRYPVILAAFVAATLTAPGLSAQPLFSEENPAGCYAFEATERLRGGFEFPEQISPVWIFVCPFGERPELEGPSLARTALEKLGSTGPDETRFKAKQLAEIPAAALQWGLCKAVNVVRSVSPPDPDRNRNRSASEIARWTCETIAGQPFDAKSRRCDWNAKPLAPRSPEVREQIRAWDLSPATLKAWHDALKAPAAALCPRTPP